MLEVEVQVNTESSAGKISHHEGELGIVRHVEVRVLWLQDRVANGEPEIQKGAGDDNVADGLTKHVERAKMYYYLKECRVCAAER